MTKRKNTKFICKKNQGGVKCEPASKLSLVSGNYHEPAEPVVMVMASIDVKIRHVFADTPITEASIGAAPPGNSIAQWLSTILNNIVEPELARNQV